MLSSILYFLLAGLFEIGGGYMMWLWWREGYGWWWGAAGAAVLALYGLIPTLQPASFGRVYAAYGGVFIALSIFWGWAIDHTTPDRYDLLGGAIALVGVAIIFFWPR